MSRLDNHGEHTSGFKRYKSKPRERAEFQFRDSFQFLVLVSSVLDYGGAIRIGRSLDGGVLAIGVYGDTKEPYTVFVHSGDEINELLEEVLDSLRSKSVRLQKAREILSATQA